MVGTPKLPRANPGTLLSIPSLTRLLSDEERESYANMNRKDLWALERKCNVDVRALYGENAWRDQSSVDIMFLLGWQLEGVGWKTRQLDQVRANNTMKQLIKGLGTYDPSAPGIEQQKAIVAEVVSLVPIFLVEGKTDIPRLADVIAVSSLDDGATLRARRAYLPYVQA